MAYTFGYQSEKSLATVDTRLGSVCRRALDFNVMDFAVIDGHRGKIRQNKAFKSGKSQVEWPNGKHNQLPSEAVDLAPYPIDWLDTGRFIVLAGIMFVAAALEGVKIRWGGDWNRDGYQRDEKFRDWGHFEIID